MRTIAYALALAAILATAITIAAAGPSPALAHDDTPPPAPTGVHASDGPNPGTATVAWDAPPDDAPSDNTPAYYRVGWVSADDIAAAQDAGQDWLDAFAFVDVANRGQTAYTVKGLTPGVRYAFIVAAVSQRFGAANWSQWAYLTPVPSVFACPTPAPTPVPPTPTATPAPTTTPTPDPTPPARGSGTANYDTDQDGLIEVASLPQLAAIRYDLDSDGIPADDRYAAAFPNAVAGMGCPADGCIGYELTADLDFDTNGNSRADAGDAYWNDGAGWQPIGDIGRRFSSNFDGNNHTIANLYINRTGSSYVGLFGSTNTGSIINQIRLVSADISGGHYVGSLVGRSSGTISSSYATGSISGRYSVGSLAGINSGTISGSYATGSVSVGYYVGGLAGQSSGTINGSYATGNVSGYYAVGGLVGRNYATISDTYASGEVVGRGSDIGGLVGRNEAGSINASYATGRVTESSGTLYIGGLVGYGPGNSAVSDSYWDTQTSGQAHSAAGGIGLTTEQLQSPTDNTGIYANWNPEYWHFGAADQYPVLQYAGLDPAAQRP